MAKRKDSEFVPDDEASFYKKLLKYRDDLSRKKQAREEKANHEIGALGFWSVVAGIAVVTDWTLTGGVITLIAGASGIEWMHHQNEAHKAGKELKEVDEKLFKMEAEQLSQKKLLPDLKSGLKDEFSRSQKDIDALRHQVKALEQELANVKNPKPVTFDKPKFGPPKR